MKKLAILGMILFGSFGILSIYNIKNPTSDPTICTTTTFDFKSQSVPQFVSTSSDTVEYSYLVGVVDSGGFVSDIVVSEIEIVGTRTIVDSLQYVEGDTNNDEVIQSNEAWLYTSSSTWSYAQGDVLELQFLVNGINCDSTITDTISNLTYTISAE